MRGLGVEFKGQGLDPAFGVCAQGRTGDTHLYLCAPLLAGTRSSTRST